MKPERNFLTMNHPANRAWIVLLIATLITWRFGDTEHLTTTIVLVIMGLAFIKGGLVACDFMELRHAPVFWRVLAIGWLVLVTSIILLAYWLGSR